MDRHVTASDGARLWCETSGDGPPLLLIHGGPGSYDYLEPLAGLIDDRFTVIRYDQRGAGRSDHVGPLTLERFLADIQDIRTAFGVDRWVVAGHSWGASLALVSALDHPEQVVRLLYLNGTGIEWDRWEPRFHEAARARLTAVELLRLDELSAPPRTPAEELERATLRNIWNFADTPQARGLAAAMAVYMQRAPESKDVNLALNAAFGARTGLAWRCADLDVPTLIGESEMDVRPTAAVDSLVAALPNATRATWRDVGHLPWLEDPEQVRATLCEFLTAKA